MCGLLPSACQGHLVEHVLAWRLLRDTCREPGLDPRSRVITAAPGADGRKACVAESTASDLTRLRLSSRKPADLQNLAPGTHPPFVTFNGEVKTDVNKIEEFLEDVLCPPK